jgi:ABC-type transport system involved in multi-copper enzyme maturation permease subunit
MKKLVRIEMIKILNYIPFRILILLYFVFFTLGIIIYPLVDKQIPVISLSDLFRFPDVWPFLTWLTEPYNILLALIIIMITTNEFNNHTFKTQVVFGLSRKELLTQKLVLILFLALFATLLIGITSMSLGLIYSYKLTLKIALENVWMMAVYMLSSITLMVFGLFISLLIKNTALSILTFLGYRTFVEPVIFAILHKSEVRWYLPLRANTQLTPLPDLIEIFQRKMDSDQPVDETALEILPEGLDLQWNILLVIAYVSILIFLSYRIMQRKRLT